MIANVKIKDVIFFVRNDNKINKSIITAIYPNSVLVRDYNKIIGKERIFKTYKEAQEYHSKCERKRDD